MSLLPLAKVDAELTTAFMEVVDLASSSLAFAALTFTSPTCSEPPGVAAAAAAAALSWLARDL